MKLAYQAYDQAGRSVVDTIEAGGPEEATEQLRRRGLFVTQIHTDAGHAAARDIMPRRARGRCPNRLKNLAMFTRQLYVLASTGTPLVEALGALERQTRGDAWRSVIGQLKQRVEEGAALSEAMRSHPVFFDPVYRNLIAAGESGGQFEPMLDRLAQLIRKQAQVRNTVTGALVYPALLLGVSGVVLAMMLLFVLPRFTGLFETLDVPLPPSTQAMILLSNTLRDWWWAGLILAAGGGFGLRRWLGTPSGREAWDTAMIRLPCVGVIARRFAMARITRLLGTLLESHVPLLEALKLTRDSAGNAHYRRLITRAEEAVTRGEAISSAFADESLVSPSVHEAIRSGEATGQIGPLLLNVAEFLDEENEVVVRSLTSILEPVILIGLGLLVGLVALSMFLPLFDLTASAGGGR